MNAPVKSAIDSLASILHRNGCWLGLMLNCVGGQCFWCDGVVDCPVSPGGAGFPGPAGFPGRSVKWVLALSERGA